MWSVSSRNVEPHIPTLPATSVRLVSYRDRPLFVTYSNYSMCLCAAKERQNTCEAGRCYRLVTKAASHTRVLTLFYRGGTGQASATRSYLSCTPLFFFPQPRCREVGLVRAPHQHYLRMLQNRTPACRDRQNMHYKQLLKLVQ